MTNIHILDSQTINKIAAGEVVERPASVIKELVENAIDAGATAITVEIKEGGISLIRVTDNGCGMDLESLQIAFERHATSKISNAEDLNSIHSLGFRGEALSSIAAVSMVEVISKTEDSMIGTRVCMEGGKNPETQQVGAPKGTTFLVRNLFYNTPARKKFLKQPITEAGYVTDLMEHLALSRPDISFKYVIQNKLRFQTNGNGQLRDVIFQIYGLEIAKALISVEDENECVRISGFVGRPELVRGNRNFEITFLNGRYIKSNLISRAIEEGCKEYLMQHKFPFCVLHLNLDPSMVDVNVHPTKMDVRFHKEDSISESITYMVKCAMLNREMIQKVVLEEQIQKQGKDTAEGLAEKKAPEPFEINRIKEHIKPEDANSDEVIEKPYNNILEKFGKNMTYVSERETVYAASAGKEETLRETVTQENIPAKPLFAETITTDTPRQMDLFEEKIIAKEHETEFRYIGQVFDTYWMIQFKDELLMIDQHAAHEKIKYERLMKQFREKQILSQNLMPPIILSLSGEEESALLNNLKIFENLGFGIEEFGGKEYALRQVPLDLYGMREKEMFLEVLDEIVEKGVGSNPEIIEDKIATMSCKAAVKGNNRLSEAEAKELIKELLELDNPYNCPHGRPTIISFSKYELDRKFKRIVT